MFEHLVKSIIASVCVDTYQKQSSVRYESLQGYSFWLGVSRGYCREARYEFFTGTIVQLPENAFVAHVVDGTHIYSKLPLDRACPDAFF